ncbi:MAG TPA: glycosyltransferase family 87 protein [Terriglobales bacterium]|jgi:hypothetical protein|nr:glycosyltransferase family 87 protein [Terriglobales bacterium]
MSKLKILLLILLLGVSVEFVIRGPYRFLAPQSRWNDLTYIYVPARALTQAIDPYDPATFASVCQCGDFAQGVRTHSMYPWTTFVVMAPLAVLPWTAALYVWTGIQVLLVLLMIWALLSVGNLAGIWAGAFVVFALALAPLHTGLASGNVSVAAIALCAIAVWLAVSKHDYCAGALIGIAMCLKPQIGICFLVYYALRRAWRVALSGAGMAAGIAVAGAAWLSYDFGATWFHYFLQNAQGFVADNKVNDFTYDQPMRFTLINFQVLFYAIVKNAAFANGIALALGVIMVGVWAWFIWRNSSHSTLLELSAICVISLLPVYHRSYDAAVLIFPICWGLGLMQRAGRMERAAAVALFLMLPFALPGGAFLQGLAQRNYVPATWVESWWWNAVAMPHEIWLLLMLACWLLYQLRFAGDRVPPQVAS